MVTRQGKDLLRNTIRSTDYHNRLLEEDDMWRQWDLERGLTMMVTDDCLKKKLRMDQYSTPNRDNYWTKKLFQVEEKDPDRWGHSGYKELYPEEFKNRKEPSPASSTSSSSSEERRKPRRKHKTKRRKREPKRKQKAEESKSSAEEGEVESDTSSSESSADERLRAERKQRLERFRRHFRGRSVQKGAKR